MKNIIMLSFLVLSTACGKYATNEDLDKVKGRVTTLEEQLTELDNRISANTYAMTNVSNSLISSEDSLQALKEELEQADADNAIAIENAITAATSSYNTLLSMVETLQGQTTSLLTKQAALELEDRVVGVFDPCPNVNSSNFKESFFQMSSGKIVAYFEDGGKRFLTVLKTGTTYRTTDSRACTFTI